MRNRRFPPILAVLAAVLTAGAGGCVFTSSDDPDFGQIFVTWSIEAPDGTPLPCKPGEFVEIIAGNVVEQFDCAPGQAETDSLPEGDYAVTFNLVDQLGVESTTTLPMRVADGFTTDAGHIIFIVNL